MQRVREKLQNQVEPPTKIVGPFENCGTFVIEISKFFVAYASAFDVESYIERTWQKSGEPSLCMWQLNIENLKLPQKRELVQAMQNLRCLVPEPPVPSSLKKAPCLSDQLLFPHEDQQLWFCPPTN